MIDLEDMSPEERNEFAESMYAEMSENQASDDETSVPVTPVCQTLTAMLTNPARQRDLAFALHQADEIAPSPATAHTALLVLRAALADVAGVSLDRLMGMFPPTAAIGRT